MDLNNATICNSNNCRLVIKIKGALHIFLKDFIDNSEIKNIFSPAFQWFEGPLKSLRFNNPSLSPPFLSPYIHPSIFFNGCWILSQHWETATNRFPINHKAHTPFTHILTLRDSAFNHGFRRWEEMQTLTSRIITSFSCCATAGKQCRCAWSIVSLIALK